MKRRATRHGVLTIDKPSGMTSHDVVARARRALGTSEIGHAGTLDPMATGLLLLLVGEATKLSPYLTAGDKRYVTTLVLGVGTDTLDAEGRVVDEREVGPALRDALRARGPLLEGAIEAERRRSSQVPPSVSAVHVGGERAYDLARRGETVTIAPRDVAVRSLDLTAVDADSDRPSLSFDLRVSKGYYVRSFAHDLGASLGLPAHLITLRRLESGPFTLEGAVAVDAIAAATLVPLTEAASRSMPHVELTEAGVTRARCGQRLTDQDFESPPPQHEAAWVRGGELVAIGAEHDGAFRVVRGFSAGLAS